jgi:hypothetical protein
MNIIKFQELGHMTLAKIYVSQKLSNIFKVTMLKRLSS